MSRGMLCSLMPLPELPPIELAEVEDLLPDSPPGFLRLHRKRLVADYADGVRSEPFVYDWVHREALDAVVIAAHFENAEGVRCVYLRSALRPPARQRPERCRPLRERASLGHLWELPAGLVEPDECNEAGLAVCAARELHEELGFEVPAGSLLPLGPASFPSPGVSFFVCSQPLTNKLLMSFSDGLLGCAGRCRQCRLCWIYIYILLIFLFLNK